MTEYRRISFIIILNNRMPNLNYTGPIQPLPENRDKGNIPGAPKAKSPNSFGKIAALVAGIVVLFVGGIIALVFTFTAGVSEAGEEFLLLMGSGEIEEAYESTAEGFKMVTDEEAFEAFLDRFPILTEVRSVSFNSVSVSGDYGTTRGTIRSRDGSTMPIMLQYVKEGEEWKVINVELNPEVEEEEVF